MGLIDKKFAPWVMWAILLAFFISQFILRVSAGVMAGPIMTSFSINATEFGLMTSFYYLGYASLQLPLGIFLDRFGPRYITTACMGICGLGVLIFATATHWHWALFGRLLIGMGSSGAFISTSKSIRSWFPEDAFTKIVGFTVTLGLFGALNGSRPVAFLMDYMSWQEVLHYLAWFVVLLALLCFLFVRNPKGFHEDATTSKSVLDGLKKVFKTRSVVIIGLLGALLVLPLSAFADVWGVPFFVKVYGWSRQDAATATSFMYFGMCFGSPLLAFLAERYKTHKQLTVLSGFVMGILLAVLLVMPPLPYKLVLGMMFIVGIFCAYQVLVFSMVTGLTPPRMSGVVIGFTNMINMASGFLFLPLVGWLIDFLLSLNPDIGFGYRGALWVMPITSITGAILLQCLKLKRY